MSSINNFIEMVKARRSARHFNSKAVTPELIEQILEATRWSPSAFNL